MLCLKHGRDENAHGHTHGYTLIIYMLRDTGTVGCLPSRCDTMISCHYELPSCLRQLTMSTLGLRPLLLLRCQVHARTHAYCRFICIQIHTCVHTHMHAHTQTGSDQFSLATSVLCSNVLIMIGFVCNYKHSETPISKSFIEFRPMGILGCF